MRKESLLRMKIISVVTATLAVNKEQLANKQINSISCTCP